VKFFIKNNIYSLLLSPDDVILVLAIGIFIIYTPTALRYTQINFWVFLLLSVQIVKL
jgi:hypothetical protein